jgi:thiol:disulfide interchange protein
MNEAGKKIWKTGLSLTFSAVVIVLAIGFLLRPKLDLTPAESSHLPWLTDLPTALAKAKAEKKRVFLNFGGSDWCAACIVLEKKIFNTKEFAAFAATNLVLVDIDLPLKKPQPEALKQANLKLSDQFHADPLPCLILLNSDGQEVFRQEGYDGSSPEKFITAFRQAIEQAKKRDDFPTK